MIFSGQTLETIVWGLIDWKESSKTENHGPGHLLNKDKLAQKPWVQTRGWLARDKWTTHTQFINKCCQMGPIDRRRHLIWTLISADLTSGKAAKHRSQESPFSPLQRGEYRRNSIFSRQQELRQPHNPTFLLYKCEPCGLLTCRNVTGRAANAS